MEVFSFAEFSLSAAVKSLKLIKKNSFLLEFPSSVKLLSFLGCLNKAITDASCEAAHAFTNAVPRRLSNFALS